MKCFARRDNYQTLSSEKFIWEGEIEIYLFVLICNGYYQKYVTFFAIAI